jgi:hypothetical protein
LFSEDFEVRDVRVNQTWIEKNSK